MAIRSLHIFALLALVPFTTAAAADADARIQRVEHGLLPGAAASGQPVPKWSIAERLRFYNVPGVSIAVVNDGKIEWARGFGVRAKDGGPVDAETLFQAASLSKHVAALVALHLVDQGALALDEDVNLKLRSWKVPENKFTKTQKVTLRRLLNHSGGFTVHGFAGYAAGAPVPSLVALLDGVKPANNAAIRVDVVPGTTWRYSGGGYAVMQQLVLDVAGRPFADLAGEFVFSPLHMAHSTFEQPLPERLAANAATGHRGDGAPIPGRWHTYPELCAAGLWTTPSDLARVVIELQTGGHVLKPATQRAMLTKVLGDYGLGLDLGEKEGHKSFSHGGANEGFRCFVFGYFDSGRGAVVMTNGDRGADLANEILRSISAEYGWVDFRVAGKR